MDIDLYIRELRHTLTVVECNHDIWRAYKIKETRSLYVDTMNSYDLFFSTSIHAHFVSLLVGLYRLYENRDDTYNIPFLLKKLKAESLFSDDKLELLDGIYKEEAKPLWIKVCILRNKAFGHRSVAYTVEEVFSEAEVTRDELRKLVDVTKKLLNTLVLVKIF